MLVQDHLDEILSRQYPEATPELIEKVQALMESAWPTMGPEEADRTAERFRWAFGLDDATRITGPPAVARESLETIVEGSWFGRYLEYTQESEAPASFHFGSVLTAIAAGLGRKPLIAWEAMPLYPNMYTLLIGPTGARKGSANQEGVALGRHGDGAGDVA